MSKRSRTALDRSDLTFGFSASSYDLPLYFKIANVYQCSDDTVLAVLDK